MVDIHSAIAEVRRGKKKKEERRNQRTKVQCPHLLRRAAIQKKPQDENIMACPIT